MKLTDGLVDDIKRLISIHEQDGRKLRHFTDTVEREYRDILQMKLDKDIPNKTAVSIFGEKLPRDIGREQAKEVNRTSSSVKNDGKFTNFLKFLLERNTVCQSADLKSIVLVKGIFHGIDAHEERKMTSRIDLQNVFFVAAISSHCREHRLSTVDLLPIEKVNLVKEHRACYSFLKVEHRSWDCL